MIQIMKKVLKFQGFELLLSLILSLFLLLSCDLRWIKENDDYKTVIEPINYNYNWCNYGKTSDSLNGKVFFQKFVYNVAIDTPLVYITSSTLNDSIRLSLGFYLIKDTIQYIKSPETERYCSFSIIVHLDSVTKECIVYHRQSIQIQVTNIDHNYIYGNVKGRLLGPKYESKYINGKFRFKNFYSK